MLEVFAFVVAVTGSLTLTAVLLGFIEIGIRGADRHYRRRK